MEILKTLNRLFVNGKLHQVKGNNVTIVNGSMFVDGDLVESGLSGTVIVKWEGDIANVSGTNIVVNGNVNGHVDGTNITCNNIGGNVDATNVKCNEIKGDVDATTVKHK